MPIGAQITKPSGGRTNETPWTAFMNSLTPRNRVNPEPKRNQTSLNHGAITMEEDTIITLLSKAININLLVYT